MTDHSVLLDSDPDLDLDLDLPPGVRMPQLTRRQMAIYVFIVKHLAERGYPPSLREIGERVGLASLSSVHAQLCHLEDLELIKRAPDRARAITVVEWDGEAA